MIVRNIIVENFRGFRGSVTVDLATSSPIIIEGPNGSGKSTLAEAITRVLADRHDMGGESAERLISTGGVPSMNRVRTPFDAAQMVRAAVSTSVVRRPSADKRSTCS